MRCEYCPTEGSGSYGENFEISRDPLAPSDVVWAANAIGSVGFDTFRLTGGEPLLKIERSVQILDGIVRAGVFKNTRLNTNGSRLAEAVPQLRQIPLTMIKVSLDTLDEDLFRRVTKSSKHAKVLLGIEAAKAAGLPVEVNAVLTAETAPGIEALVDWCFSRSIGLKILDLVGYESQVKDYLSSNKAPGSDIDEILEAKLGQPKLVQLSSDRGIYMKRYGTNPSVLFKDCSAGTTYTNYCKGCPHFPCEEGIHHLSLSTDGHLRPCRIRNNVFWDIVPIIRAKDAHRLQTLVRELLSRFYVGEYSLKRGTVTISS
jgi:cyclic pyranopterin phosphate synthase